MIKSAANIKNRSQIGKTSALVVAIALILGLPIVLFSTQQTTDIKQHASQFNDLNTASAITETNNPDGTMGAATYLGNFSNEFPVTYLGKLDFQIIDPPQNPPGKRNENNPHFQKTVTPTPYPTRVYPTQIPTYSDDQRRVTGQASDITRTENPQQDGAQTVTSLLVTISKVEVHLAYIGFPGGRNEDLPTPTPIKPNVTPVTASNHDVDKWETLNIGAPKTVDLVQLAKTHAFSSLGITKLVNGRYTEIRLYVSTASATLQDGTKVSPVIPGRNNIVRVVEPFVIDSSKITAITMDFDAQNSVIKVGNQYILKPVVANILQKYQDN